MKLASLVVAFGLMAGAAFAQTPPAVTATPSSSTEIDLTWTPALPETGATIQNYKVLRDGKVIATLGAKVLNYADTALTAATTYTYMVEATEQLLAKSAAVSATTFVVVTPPPPPPPTSASIPLTAARPAYNTGTGFYVVGRGIYDANGNLFTPMGANRQHYDASEPTRFQAHPNVERLVPFFNQDWATVNKPLLDEDVTNKVVPIPTVFYTNYDTGTETTGATDLATLNTAVGFWTSQAANWTTYNNIAMFNIVNEWGPCADDSNPSDYQNGYVTAIQKMRAAGYTAPLIVDAPCGGEGVDAILAHAAAIEAADPLHSVVFSIHSYGEFYKTTPICNGCGWQWSSTLQNLAALPVPVIFGEFGCGPACGDTNSTPVLPDDIMQSAQSYGFGWMAWSWDDGGCQFNLLGPCPSTTGVWDIADMTAYGKDVITSPVFGMQAAARPATVFP